jgi:PAB-dependent poly(A)-specific ribonuclease subunit 2
MCFLSRGTSELLVAGCQGKMFKIDVEKGEVVQTVQLSFQ